MWLKNKVCLAASRSCPDDEAPACSLVCRHWKRVVSAWSPPAGAAGRSPCVCRCVFNEALVVFLKGFRTLRECDPGPDRLLCAALKSLLSASQKRRGDSVCEAGSASDVSTSMTCDLRRPDACVVTLKLSEQISAALSPRRPLFKHLLSRHQVVGGCISHAAVGTMFVLMEEQSR